MILYRQVIKEAWQNTRQNYWLWVAGLFAAILTNVGQYSGLVNTLDGTNGWLRVCRELMSWVSGGVFFVKSAFSSPLVFLMCLALVGVVLIILFLAINSQILVTRQIQAGLKAGDQPLARPTIGFWSQIKRNWSTFWPTVGVVAAIKLILLLCLLVISLTLSAVYLVRQPIIGVFLYVLVALLFAVLIWFVAVWSRYWLLLLLTDKQSNWLLAAKEAATLIQRDFLASLEMSIIVILINLLAYLVWVFVMHLVAIPFALLGLLLVKYLAFSQLLLAVFAKVMLASSLVFLVGLMVVFETSLWLSFLNNLASGNLTNKLGRVFRRR